jgi:hypothetical protein
MVPPAELGRAGPREDLRDTDPRPRGRRHRMPADSAPDGAVPERAGEPWAGEPAGSRRRPAESGAAAATHTGPRLRYKTTVEVAPDPGTSPGTGPMGGIRTYQPGTGPHVALDDPASFWAGSGPQPAVDTGPRRAPADQPTADRLTADRPTADRPTVSPDIDGRSRKRRSASAAAAPPSVDRDAGPAGTGPRWTAEQTARSAEPGRTAERTARSAEPGRTAAGPASAGPAG